MRIVMDLFNLTAIEARIIGCLMEKSVVTPDQYPLTLNSLTNACNQKSSRDPIMSLDPGKVQQAARELKAKHLVRIEENFKSGVEKYKQIFCNTNLGNIQLDRAQFAVVCILLLRGPQTASEIKVRCKRLYDFTDNQQVVSTLNKLIEGSSKSFVIKLPRMPGRKDSVYMHLFSGPIEVTGYEAETVEDTQNDTSNADRFAQLEQRVSDLESEIAKLKEALGLND
jgi:uncharacterized protein